MKKIQFKSIAFALFALSMSVLNAQPIVKFNKPVDGQVFSVGANILADVAATSPAGIKNVQLYINDKLIHQENTAPYEWGGTADPLLNNVQRGPYALKAIATANDGKTTTQFIGIQVGARVEPPTVAFANLKDGDVFPVGTALVVEITGTHEFGIEKVDLTFAGKTFTDFTSPYIFSGPELSNLKAGSYSISAAVTAKKVGNLGGNVSESTLFFGVRDIPVVNFINPIEGQEIQKGSMIPVQISASQASGIQSVQLTVDGVLIGKVLIAPYEFVIDSKTLAVGTHKFGAIARSTDNQVNIEKIVNIKVVDNSLVINRLGVNTDKINDGYSLSVNGKARFSNDVEVFPTWADFVFKQNYKLDEYNDIRAFINENGHLKGIPSESEVKANGIGVGEMNTKLLQKVEELTLYILDLENRLKTLEKK